MKKQLFIAIILVSIALTTNAKVLTVSNNPNAVAQYTDIPPAIAAALPGDTIYVGGSPNSYSNFTIDRKLVIIGAGFGNPSTPTGYSSFLNYYSSITVDSSNTASPSGTRIIGLSFNTIDWANGSHPIPKNISIERCAFSNCYVRGDGWKIINCVIWSWVGVYNNANTKIYNNIFYGYIQGSNNTLSCITIDHNIFIGSSYAGLNSLGYDLITNNLFWQVGSFYNYYGTAANSSNCTFSNNMSIIASGTSITFPNGSLDISNNNGSGNFNNTDPKFVNVNSTSSNNYGTQDFHLLPASTAKGAATDLTDLGIYGGLYPWVSNIGVSNIPQITQFNIANPNVATNGTLKVTVKAIKQK